jgi:hypothetical protein
MFSRKNQLQVKINVMKIFNYKMSEILILKFEASAQMYY